METFLGVSCVPDHKIYLSTLSGGLDSFLLTYMILNDLPNSKVVLSTATHKHLNYYNVEYVNGIREKFDELFPNRIIEHKIVKYNDRADARARRGSVTRALVEKHNIDGLFSGMTANPSDVENLLTDDRDFTRDTPGEEKTHSMVINGKIVYHYQPFVNYTKKKVAELYQQYDIMDLTALTISCESKTPPRPCKDCWWCREKHWAFNFY